MKTAIRVAIVLVFLSTLFTAAASANGTLEIFQSKATFLNETGADLVPFPLSADTALPHKPFGSGLLDYSCIDKNVGIVLGSNDVTVKAPAASSWICFIGSGWNAGSSNTNPTPVSPTIVANAEDDYHVVEFENPAYAVGFELLTNSAASETITITYIDASTEVLDDSKLGTAPNAFEFVGFRSLKPIASVAIDTTGGATQNEGIVSVWVNDEAMTRDLSDCTHQTYAGYRHVETLFVSAVGPGQNTPVVSSTALVSGLPYTIEASGVYYAGGHSTFDIRADAEYSQDAYERAHDLPWGDSVRDYGGYGEGLLELKIDDQFIEWGSFAASHVYTHGKTGEGSPLEFEFQIYDIYAQNNTGGLCVSIFEMNMPPDADPNGPYTGFEGSSVSFDGTDSSDLNGDALSYAWDFGDSNSGSGASPSHTYADDDTYNVCLTVTDPDGLSDTKCTTATILNVAPDVSIDSPTDGALFKIDVPVGLSATFTDPGAEDTHTCSVDWGPVTTSGTVTESDGNGTCTDAYSYAAAGVYTIAVTVADDDGGQDTDRVMVVVYDPDGGFVTGGGWINSPEGAYKPGASLTGKASFGFVSKYRRGASVPTGNTEFVFHAGALNFHSTSYDFLVVNQGGSNAQFKGSGTINGAGSYKFMLWATDGDPDTFRIRIWEEVGDSEVVIYDNGTDQPIGGGSIVVHTK